MPRFEIDPEARLDLFATGFAGPAEIAVYRSNLKLALATAKPMVDEAVRNYDEMLEDFASSQEWKN